jgi:nicotinamide riboside kinase
MATRVAVMGLPNTGKSFSRTYIKKGEECFVISPSAKESHLFLSDGKPAQMLDMSIKTVVGLEKIAEKMNTSSRHDVIRTFAANSLPEGTTITGNFAMVSDMKYVSDYLKFIDKHMPHIKNVFIADFTHFISTIIASKEFMSRKQGGQAFERYWDLAADSLNQLLLSVDLLQRRELIVVIEFHSAYSSEDDIYKIFVPAGKMLTEKFMPESYFDFVVHTSVIPWEDEKEEENRFKFVVVKKQRYDGRMANIFKYTAIDGTIPNNMETLLQSLRQYLGI